MSSRRTVTIDPTNTLNFKFKVYNTAWIMSSFGEMFIFIDFLLGFFKGELSC